MPTLKRFPLLIGKFNLIGKVMSPTRLGLRVFGEGVERRDGGGGGSPQLTTMAPQVQLAKQNSAGKVPTSKVHRYSV